MPAGLPYFAWIDPDEVVFLPGHMRWDESVFSFTLKQDEGDPASLTAVVRRPRNEYGDPIGLLGPGRKIWIWFALDCGAAELLKFRGRLVGIPTSIFEELVTLEFVARPFDVVAQKEALAATLRVLPYYDEVMIDKDRRDDPEVVLEGYTANWHYDRESHILTVSDEIIGEDGLVEFDGESEAGKVLWDGLGLTLSSGPLAQVDVKAEFTWTQRATGQVDLTAYLVNNWPNEEGVEPGVITSFTLKHDNWPKNGAGIGDGWTVANATASPTYSLESHTKTEGSTLKVNWWDGGSTTTTFTETVSGPVPPPGSMHSSYKVTQDKATWKQGRVYSAILKAYMDITTSFSRSFSNENQYVPLHHSRVTLVAGYAAQRQCTEQVTFTLFSDVQSIMTDPEDGEALRVDDLKSINLSGPIDEEIGTASGIAIDDPRRRSYICTERGNRSLEYCIAIARAHLLKRARVVEIAFAPKLARMPEITLRKNVSLIEPRIGEAVGKIVGYSLGLDGNDGQVRCEVRIGCTIGNGGSQSPEDGEPTYCTVDYCGHDYQVFTGRTLVVFDSSVGYQPPAADPNDDGIDFLSTLSWSDVIEVPLVVENGPAVQRSAPKPPDEFPTRATFKLKSMTREFSTPYELQITDLKIPTGIDLTAT